MRPRNLRLARFGLLLLIWAPGCAPAIRSFAGRDPLPSWSTGQSRQAIEAFVRRVTTPGQPGFVPVEQRIAVFDNDGTLCCEHPLCAQYFFAVSRVKANAPRHPEWKTQQPFKAALEGDGEGVFSRGIVGLIELTSVADAGISTTEFQRLAREWIVSARHPRFNCPYTDIAYQPMVELLAYLRTAGFKSYVVTAGNGEFVRAWSERVYGIPPEQVIGSVGKTAFKVEGDRAELVREPAIDFLDDHESKAVNVDKFIGRRPIVAFGNSDSDLPMLQYAASSECDPGQATPRLIALIHHTDAEREYAYDRETKNGHLNKGIEEAARRGWLVVDMKQDWRRVFAFEKYLQN